eukprot:m51a1_g9908 putative tyrosine-protein kinase fes fps (895) ;mRNA; r:95091-98772
MEVLELVQWLKDAGVDPKYADITVAAIPMLRDEDFERLGIKTGPKRLIQAHAAERLGQLPSSRSPRAHDPPAPPSDPPQQQAAAPAAAPGAPAEQQQQQQQGGMLLEDPHVLLRDVAIGEELGRGSFGVVFRGRWQNVDVAAKRLLEPSHTDEFVREVRMAAILRHPNVVLLYGLYKDPAGLMYVVTEFAQEGSLLSLLRSPEGAALPVDELLVMAKDMASGMEYLASQDIVHRDLAARNVFVFRSAGDQRRTLKIGDFGLSRFLVGGEWVRTKSIIPMRWTAPEAIEYDIFNDKSDVWSYAVTLWEMFALVKPYPDLSSKHLLKYLKSGSRLPQPQRCPKAVHDLMMCCWDHDPKKRPTFGQVRARLDECLAAARSSPASAAPRVSRINMLQAIAAASDGAVLQLQEGVHVLNEMILLMRTINIRGPESGEALVQVAGDFPAFEIRDACVSIANVRLAPAKQHRCALVKCSGARAVLTLSRCAVDGCVSFAAGSAGRVEHCVFNHSSGTGVEVEGGASPHVVGSTFLCCMRGAAVAASSPVFEGCVFKGNSEGAVVSGACEVRFEQCDFERTSGAALAVASGCAGVELVECAVHDGEGLGVDMQADSRVSLLRCSMYNNSKRPALQNDGGCAIVRACTIYANRFGFYIKNRATGELVDCDIRDSEQTGIELKRGACPSVVGCRVHGCKQSGVFVHEGGEGAFKNCYVYENGLSGVELSDPGTRPRFESCTVYACKANGVTAKNQAQGDFRSCSFKACSHGVLARARAALALTGCAVAENRMDGVNASEEASAQVTQCDVSGNAQNGVCCGSAAAVSLVSCKVVANRAAAVVASKDCALQTVSCTVETPGGGGSAGGGASGPRAPGGSGGSGSGNGGSGAGGTSGVSGAPRILV